MPPPGASPVAQSGKAGVDLAVDLYDLRNQSQVGGATVKEVIGRKSVLINGVWTDDGFDAKLTVIKIKAMSEAYFRMLERHPQMREVFQLGNRIVWVTPSQAALVIDTADGQEKMTDEQIDRLFVAKK
jgi:Ca-activated chloride channel family protein